MWRPSSLGTCFRTRPKKPKTIWEKKQKTKKHKSRSVYRIRIGLLFSMIYLENRYTNICSSSMFNAKKSAHKGVRIIRTPYSVCRECMRRVATNLCWIHKIFCCVRIWYSVFGIEMISNFVGIQVARWENFCMLLAICCRYTQNSAQMWSNIDIFGSTTHSHNSLKNPNHKFFLVSFPSCSLYFVLISTDKNSQDVVERVCVCAASIKNLLIYIVNCSIRKLVRHKQHMSDRA